MTESIRATYDSRETGPRYHVTTTVNGRLVGKFMSPIEDPFVRQTVTVGWPDLLRGLLRRSLEVVVTVGGDNEIVNDVLELDDNCLVPGRSRRREFNADLTRSMRRMLAATDGEDEYPEVSGV